MCNVMVTRKNLSEPYLRNLLVKKGFSKLIPDMGSMWIFIKLTLL